MQFLKENAWIEICSYWQIACISSGSLCGNKQHAIIWNNDDPVYRGL